MTTTELAVCDTGALAEAPEYATYSASSELVTTVLTEVTPRRMRWTWRDRIPQDAVTILAGRGGEGKTTFAAWLAARLTRGELPGEYEGRAVPVLFQESEDPVAEVTAPRLLAAGADPALLHIVDGVNDGATAGCRGLRLPGDLSALRGRVRETRARLVVLSPILSTVAGDLNKGADVRAMLDPLNRFAQEEHVTVLGIAHLRKGGGARGGDMLSGSHAIRDAARSLMLLARDSADDTRVLSLDKGNYSRDGATALQFTIENATVPGDGGEVAEVGCVVNVAPTDKDASEILNAERDPYEARSRNDVQAFLIDYLTDAGGAAKAADVIQAAVGTLGVDKRAVQNAQQRCRNPWIESGRLTGAQHNGWQWMLSESPPKRR